MIRMNRSFGSFCRVLLLLLAAALFPAGAEAHAAASSAGRAEDTAAQEIAEEEPDVKRIVLGHVGDSYEWHIATAGGREWSLPLPVIVHSPSSGWHCFSAKRLRGGAEYEGLRIAADGDHAGKIVERQADGSDLRPLDLSITKTVAGLLLNSALVVALVLIIKFTKIGVAMRAVSKDFETSQLMGIKINRVISVTFIIGSLLAAVGSILYFTNYPSVIPTSGSMPGLKSFVAAVFGGIGSIPGAVIGAFIIGICENLIRAVNIGGVSMTTFSDAFTFALLIVILCVKPTGLFGERTTEKV